MKKTQSTELIAFCCPEGIEHGPHEKDKAVGSRDNCPGVLYFVARAAQK